MGSIDQVSLGESYRPWRDKLDIIEESSSMEFILDTNMDAQPVNKRQYLLADKEFDHRTIAQKISGFIQTLFNELKFHFSALKYYLRCGDADYAKFDLQSGSYKDTKFTSCGRGLYVMIHDVMGHPSIWHKQIEQVRLDASPLCARFIPFIPNQGNCNLETAADPILNKIIEYTKMYPERPICLLGTGYGATLCHYIETQLREKAPGARVMLSSVAGVHLGSGKMNLVNRIISLLTLGLYKRYTVVVREYLTPESAASKALLDRVNAPLGDNTRKFVYHASCDDTLVPIGSALPLMEHEHVTFHHIMSDAGHRSFVGEVADKQVQGCMMWMNEQNAAYSRDELQVKVQEILKRKGKQKDVQVDVVNKDVCMEELDTTVQPDVKNALELMAAEIRQKLKSKPQEQVGLTDAAIKALIKKKRGDKPFIPNAFVRSLPLPSSFALA